MPTTNVATRNWLLTIGLALLFLLALLAFTKGVQGQADDAEVLEEVGGETLVAHFANGPNAVTTQQEYSGLVTITVSGIGQASATQYSDAFYILTDYAGNPIKPGHPTLLYNWVLWINGQHAENLIPGQAVPAYREDHIYTIEIEAPGGNLTFGVGDTGTGDNTGSYTIDVGRKRVTVRSPSFHSKIRSGRATLYGQMAPVQNHAAR